jgi:tetratricopeptide (TPR) repeat protein
VEENDRMQRLMTALAFSTLLAGNPVAADTLGEVRSGNAAFGEGRYEAAVDAYSRAILAGDLDPEALAVTFNNRGVAYSELGDYDRAIQDYGQALGLKPGDATAIKNLRIAHIRRAGAAAQLGEQDAALADYNQAIELDPNHPLAYMRRGQLLLDQGVIDAAIKDLTRAQQLDPGNQDIAGLLTNARQAAAATAETPAVAAAAPPSPVPAAPPSAGAPATEAAEPARAARELASPAPVEPGAGPAEAGAGRPFRVITAVNFRAGPGNEFPRVGTLAEGTSVHVLGENKGWLQIRLRNGGQGYVYKKWLQAEGSGGTSQ